MSRTLPGLTVTAIVLSAFTQPLCAQTRPALTIGTAAPRLVPASEDATARTVGQWQSDDTRHAITDERGNWLGLSATTHHHGTAGAVIGVLIGGTAGGLLIFKSTESVEHNLKNVPLGVLGGGVAGGLIGYAVGRSLRTDVLAPVATAGMQFAITPKGPGVRITF